MLKEGYYTTVFENNRHLTFRIKSIKDGSLAGKVKIGYLIGSNNEKAYKDFGFVSGDFVNVWKRFLDSTSQETLTKLRAAVQILKGNPDDAGRAYALQSGLCYRCNRLLTNPVSIQNGIGPECSRK